LAFATCGLIWHHAAADMMYRENEQQGKS